MTTPRDTAERRMTAYLDNADSRNVIHSPEEATRYGYESALVTGVVVYGWAVPALVEVLGERWLRDGWTEVRFRRPVYAGDEMRAVVERRSDGACDFSVVNQRGEACTVGQVGVGRAAWFGELGEAPARRSPEPAPNPRGHLGSVAAVPIGEALVPKGVLVSPEEAARIAGRVRDDDPRYQGEAAVVHPYWLGSQMYQLLLHSYDQYPSMHVHSQLQHLAPVRAGQTLALAGRFVEAYEHNGSEYLRIVGGIFGEDGSELVRVRYTTVFNIARRD